LSSDDSLASFNEDVAEELEKKNPSPFRELFFPGAFKPGEFSLMSKTFEKLSIPFLPILHQVQMT
jgi:hypothetical protein